MKLEEFIGKYKKALIREDYCDAIHVKMLTMCRKRALEESKEKVMTKPSVVCGMLLHLGVDVVTGYEPVVFVKEVDGYKVYGTPDLVDGDEVIEVKFSEHAPKKPRSHDELQLKLYLWLCEKEIGRLWYFTPRKYVEFEVSNDITDDYVINLIEEPRVPFYNWECKTCSLRDECLKNSIRRSLFILPD